MEHSIIVLVVLAIVALNVWNYKRRAKLTPYERRMEDARIEEEAQIR